MQEILKRLNPGASTDIATPETARDSTLADADRYLTDFSRAVDIGPLKALLSAMTMDEDASKRARVESDKWLAPRLHAVLRLHRDEAADPAIWHYLAVCIVPDYVIWRWGRSGKVNRRLFLGDIYRNALARLWWGAELSRNGSDYATTIDAFEVQNIVHYLGGVKAFFNRAAALAFIRFINDTKRTADEGSISDYVTVVSRALNHALTTVMLDAVAPDSGVDTDAVEEWIHTPFDPLLLLTDEPRGPDEDPVDEGQVAAVEGLIKSIAPQVPKRAAAA